MKGKRKLFELEPLASPSDPPLTYPESLGDFILLVDPSLLPTSNFLPSTNALSLTDRCGRKRASSSAHHPQLSNIEGVELLADDVADNGGGESDGVVDAILQGAINPRQALKQLERTIIDAGSDSSNDHCCIVYSVPSSSVAQIEGDYHPLVHSLTDIVVKKEPTETGAPSSPTLWEDFTSLEDAYAAHETYVCQQNVYTP